MKPKKKRKRITKELFLDRLNRWFCPIALGTAICFCIIHIIYPPDALKYTLLAVPALIITFILLDLFKMLKGAGGLLYILCLLVVNIYTISLVFRGTYTGVNPIAWFYGEEGVSGWHPTYMRALFTGGGFFLASILYYFTQVRYRSLGVMLCTLFPFVFYAKRGDIMSEIMITLILTLFLAVMIHNRRLDPAKDPAKLGRVKIDRAYVISFALFISITAAIAMTVQKPTYRSQLEKSADFFETLFFSGAGSSGYENMSSSSSSRRGGFSYNNNPLFYVHDEDNSDIYYLRRQVYGKFNGDTWESNTYSYWRKTPYSADEPEYGTEEILQDAAVVFGDKVPVPDTALALKHIRLADDDFHSTFLPAPYGTITDDEPYYALKYYKYSPTSDIFRIRTWSETPKKLDDDVYFLSPQPNMTRYAMSFEMTGEEYLDALSQDGSPEAARLKEDYDTAVSNYTDYGGQNERINELARQVTKNCRGDYAKAAALESYFTLNGFTYSTEYIPPDNSLEYFIFNSKTGYCAGYATAMTVMARAVGLPARYVEGFAAFERMPAGEIVVREGHAHAFVEVYIPGAGWMTFDPTVSDYRSITSASGNLNTNFVFYLLFLLSRFFIVLIIAAFIIFFVLFDRIKERLLRIALVFMPVKKRVLKLYSNLIGLMNHSTKEEHNAYTVKMLRSEIKETRGTVPEKLLQLFEKTAFGGYEPTKEEYIEAYKEYKKCYKYLRRVPREKELAGIKEIQA